MIEILTIENQEYWDSCVKKVPDYDVFYLSGYLKAFQLQGSGKPLLAVYSNGTDYAVNAFFRRDVAEDEHFKGRVESGKYYDIITPYGYGGFIGTVEGKEKLVMEWNTYCTENNLISEFVRFSLFTDYKDYFDGKVETHTHNVVRSLEISLDDMWMDFKQKVRKNVKKANSFGLEIIRDNTGEYLDDFLRIYYGTMDRTDAEDEYYFSKRFFRTLISMPDNIMFFHAVYEGKIISTELVIYGAENVYSYLGGTDKDYFHVRPNDFLKYEVIKWAKEKGLKNFVLGGGYGSDDGIFQYKTCLAPHGITDFYIGKKVINMEGYRELMNIRSNGNRDIEEQLNSNGFFPAYRGGGYRRIAFSYLRFLKLQTSLYIEQRKGA